MSRGPCGCFTVFHLAGGFLLIVLKDYGGAGFRQILDILTNTLSAYHSFAGETDNTVF